MMSVMVVCRARSPHKQSCGEIDGEYLKFVSHGKQTARPTGAIQSAKHLSEEKIFNRIRTQCQPDCSIELTQGVLASTATS